MENPIADGPSSRPLSKGGNHFRTSPETPQSLLSPWRCGGHVESDLDLLFGYRESDVRAPVSTGEGYGC